MTFWPDSNKRITPDNMFAKAAFTGVGAVIGVGVAAVVGIPITVLIIRDNWKEKKSC